MAMTSFTIKLIIIIITFIMIFDDASADCPSELYEYDLFSEDNGLLNVINFFSNLIDKYEGALIQNYENIIINNFNIIYGDTKPTFDFNKFSIYHLYSHSIIYNMKQTKIMNAETWCKSNAAGLSTRHEECANDLQQLSPDVCIGDLKERGYNYNLGIFNYVFSKKEPSLLSEYTDYLSKMHENSDIQDSTKWCQNHKSELLGYSNEYKNNLIKSYNNRQEELFNHVTAVCIGILNADGFTIEKNGKNNYDFYKKSTYFVELYTKYLDEEAVKLADKFDGTVKWCRSNGFPVGCLENLAKAGFNDNKTGVENYNFLKSRLNDFNLSSDLSNYEKNRDYYLDLIMVIFKNEIAKNYCDKLCEQFINGGELPTSTEFCTNYKEIKEE